MKTALLIIDAQVNMFDESMPIHQAERTFVNLKTLCEKARHSGNQIIFVRHDGGEGAIDAFGSPGWELHPELVVQDGDTLIDKREPDAFQDTPLQSQLEGHAIDHLIIAGMQTDYCINATTRRALAPGYAATVVSDAHSTFDADGKTASELIAEHNHAFAELTTVSTAADVQIESNS